MSRPLGKKQYQMLGKLLYAKKPEIANELIALYDNPDNQPVFTDLAMMEPLFEEFCRIHKIDPADYRGSLRKSAKVEMRRHFIAVALHLFNPQVYCQPSSSLVLKPGLVAKLAKTLSFYRSHIHLFIHEVVAREQIYRDFKEKVLITTAQLINQTNGNGKA